MVVVTFHIYSPLPTILSGVRAIPLMVLDNVGLGAAHLSILVGYFV